MSRNSRGQFEPGRSGNPRGTSKDIRPVDIPDIGVRSDGTWTSELTRIGTSRDKRMSHTHGKTCLSYKQIAELWEQDGLACKAIESPSSEAFRSGYELVLGDKSEDEDFKEVLEDALEDLGADDAIDLAWQYKRAYGGGIIYLGTNDSSKLEQPLELDKVRNIEYLTVFEPMELIPESPSGDLGSYGRPEYYRINSNGSYLYGGDKGAPGSRLKENRPKVHSLIHESRLIVLEGIKTSRYLQTTNEISPYYGTSVVPRFYDALRDCGVGFSAAGILATDVGQPVIKIPGLLQMVAKGEGKLNSRMQAIELSRSTARAILLDEREEYARQDTSLAHFPELLDRLSVYLSAHIDIPLSVLFGYSPSSLGQPAEVELKLWYNKIRSMQRRKLTPIIKHIVRLLMRTKRQRKLPKKFSVEWFPLETLNEKDLAEARLNQARADEIYLKYGTLAPDEIRKARWTGRFSYETSIDVNTKAPGFVAPIPKGVGGAGGQVGGPVTAGAHTVTAYARRDPSTTKVAVASRGDEIDLEYAESELAHAETRLKKAIAARAPEHVLAAHRYVVEYEREALELARQVAAVKSDEDGSGKHVTFAGMQVCVESPRGSVRTWVDTDGTPGSTTMKHDYGYVVGSRGTDGDSVDVYLGPNAEAQWVYVVHQNSKASDFTEYDEDKVMLGFDSPNAARDAYLEQYDDPRFFGSMTMMTVDEFRLKIFAQPSEKVAA